MNIPTKVNPILSEPFTYGDWKAGKLKVTQQTLQDVEQVFNDNDIVSLLGDDFLAEINEILPDSSQL